MEAAITGSLPPKILQLCSFAIFWMDLQGEREELSSMLATTFAKIAGVAGRQSLIGHVQWDRWELWQVRNRRGGFLPVFWNVPRADTHAVEDIGGVVGLQNAALSRSMLSLAWQCCTIGTT